MQRVRRLAHEHEVGVWANKGGGGEKVSVARSHSCKVRVRRGASFFLRIEARRLERRAARVPFESWPTMVFAGVAPPSFARPPLRILWTMSDTCSARSKGRESLNTWPSMISCFFKETNNWGRGGRGARGDERCASARAYRQASRPRVLQNLVTRVLDRALLERAGALAFADLFAHLSPLDRPWYGSHPGWESRRTNRKCTWCPRRARAENTRTAAETPFHAPSVSRSARRGAFPRVDGCARARSRPAS